MPLHFKELTKLESDETQGARVSVDDALTPDGLVTPCNDQYLPSIT